MKSLNLLLAATALGIAATGCHTTPTKLTELPGRNQPLVSANTNADKITPDDKILTTEAPTLPNPPISMAGQENQKLLQLSLSILTTTVL